MSTTLMGLGLGAATGLVVLALVHTIRFVPHAENAFWALTVLALLAEFPLFWLTRLNRPGQLSLSIGPVFAIFVLWGLWPAVIVQALAIAVRAVDRQFPWWQAALRAARLICGLGAAELTLSLLGRPGPEHHPDPAGATAAYLVPALAWFVVSFGLVVVAQVLGSGTSPRTELGALREDMLATAAVLLLVFPLLPTMREYGWWSILYLVPLLIWNQLARGNANRLAVASREPVTGTLTHRGLQATVEALTTPDPLDPDRVPAFGIVLVNVEAVRAINQDLGRDVYDAVIVAAADRLVHAYGRDQVGRYAGEGFIVLLPGLIATQAREQAERVAQVLEPPVELAGVPFRLGPVAGVALSPEHGRDLDTLAGRAELAMGQARARSHLTDVYVPESSAAVRRRIGLIVELQATLDDPDRAEREISVLYQPQVALDSGRLVGVEALMRWTHPRWGPVPVDEVIAAVESSEVMHSLTRHIIDRVTAQLARWNALGFRARVAINVSVHDLDGDGALGLVRTLAKSLDRHGLAPDQVTVEITEGALTADREQVTRAAHLIRGLGVGLSLDDFGTGYASLRQLRLLPFTEVKIDQSYVRGMVTQPADRATVTAMHHYARALGLELVAEGVADAQIVAALASLPGVIAQGYHFGRPMSAAEIMGWRRRPAPAGDRPEHR